MSDPPRPRRRVVEATARRPPAELQSIRVIVDRDQDTDVSFMNEEGFEDRRAEYERNDFHFVTVRAVAEVAIEGVVQTLMSGGLGGVESDADNEEFVDIAMEEYAQLRKILKTIGVPTAQLPAADPEQVRVWMEWRE